MKLSPIYRKQKGDNVTQSCLTEVVNSILYKLKTSCQWHMLPVKSLFTGKVLSYQALFWHFRKWCKDGSWRHSWISLLDKYKQELDLSSADIDGSHTTGPSRRRRGCLPREKKQEDDKFTLPDATAKVCLWPFLPLWRVTIMICTR